jgi:CubicO group peptidase (beta-lactamase class C family)
VPVCTFSVACSDGPLSAPIAVDSLVYVTPEQAGFSSSALAEVEEYAEHIGSAAVVALHDNRVFFTWGDVDRKYLVHSIRKSLLNSLYGIYVERGTIDTAATLAQVDIDDIPPSLTAAEKQARVAHLLRSRSGVYHEAAAES